MARGCCVKYDALEVRVLWVLQELDHLNRAAEGTRRFRSFLNVQIIWKYQGVGETHTHTNTLVRRSSCLASQVISNSRPWFFVPESCIFQSGL